MTDLAALLTLPLDTIAVLAAGYLGYRLAFVGKDASHSGVDVLFLSLVYALAAKLAMAAAAGALAPPLLAPLTGIAAALGMAALWRRFGEAGVFRLLRRTGVSTSDRHLTAWDGPDRSSFSADADHRPSQGWHGPDVRQPWPL